MIIRCLFFFVSFIGWGSVAAQLNSEQAERLVETLLSTQNPLVVVEEIAHDGLTVTPEGDGYRVQVQSPRIPGRTAFGSDLEFTLEPQTNDLVQVRVSNIQPSVSMGDGEQLSFTPTTFSGLYSIATQGFESLRLGVSDLAYTHPDLKFSLNSLDLNMREEGDLMLLTFAAQGYAADLQDVVDAQETVGALNLTLAMPKGQAKAGDLLHLANRVFEILVDAGAETTNSQGKSRTLPTDLQGLSFELVVSDWAPKWMALRDEGTRDIMSDSQVPNITVRGEVVPTGQGLADLLFNVSLDGATMTAPEGALAAKADLMGGTIILRGIEASKIGDLFSEAEGAQSAALGAILGSFAELDVSAVASGLSAASPAEDAQVALSSTRFDLTIASPRSGAPNSKDIDLGLSLASLDAAYPFLLSAFEPAWSTLLQPALPEAFNLQMNVDAVPGEIWRSLAGLFVDSGSLPQDTVAVTEIPSLTLDGTQYVSDLVNANIGGTLTFAPGASLFAVGNLT